MKQEYNKHVILGDYTVKGDTNLQGNLEVNGDITSVDANGVQKQMYSETQLKKIAGEAIELKGNIDLDEITEPGIYKVSNVSINGKTYDGTLVVLPWDNLYFRQVLYTIDNASPNPIFTRVRVNQTHPWKEWEEVCVKPKLLTEPTNIVVADNLEYDITEDGCYMVQLGVGSILNFPNCNYLLTSLTNHTAEALATLPPTPYIGINNEVSITCPVLVQNRVALFSDYLEL